MGPTILDRVQGLGSELLQTQNTHTHRLTAIACGATAGLEITAMYTVRKCKVGNNIMASAAIVFTANCQTNLTRTII